MRLKMKCLNKDEVKKRKNTASRPMCLCLRFYLAKHLLNNTTGSTLYTMGN